MSISESCREYQSSDLGFWLSWLSYLKVAAEVSNPLEPA
jgi:hypothetical protein